MERLYYYQNAIALFFLLPGKAEKMGMSVSLQVVVASPDVENRRQIAMIVVNLGLDPICISSVAQCRELLAKEHIDLIFCDRFLSDGDYCDILTVSRSSRSQPHLVLVCRHTNADYQQAIADGVFGVISVPYRPTDVEWMLIQAKRKQGQRGQSELDRGTPELLPARKASSKRVA
jgi:DNA-binding NtrC family response regulator